LCQRQKNRMNLRQTPSKISSKIHLLDIFLLTTSSHWSRKTRRRSLVWRTKNQWSSLITLN